MCHRELQHECHQWVGKPCTGTGNSWISPNMSVWNIMPLSQQSAAHCRATASHPSGRLTWCCCQATNSMCLVQLLVVLPQHLQLCHCSLVLCCLTGQGCL